MKDRQCDLHTSLPNWLHIMAFTWIQRLVLRWGYTILPVLQAQCRLCSGGHFIETVT